METSPLSQPSQDSLLGRSMGAYRLARKIGEGGMGAVYEALDIERGRRVAVKVLLRGRLDAADAVSRFFNEAKAVTAVSHPGLVTIYEHGQSSTGEPYIAMELLEGESLRERHERQYLGRSALDLVRQLAQALAAIHTKRIVHRDLKPDSVSPEETWLNFGWTGDEARRTALRTETASRRWLHLRQHSRARGIIPLCRS